MHDDAPPAGPPGLGHPESGPPALRIAPGSGVRSAAAVALRTSPARIDGPEFGGDLGRDGFTTRDVDDDAPSGAARYERVMDRLCTQVEPVGHTAAILASIRAEL